MRNFLFYFLIILFPCHLNAQHDNTLMQAENKKEAIVKAEPPPLLPIFLEGGKLLAFIDLSGQKKFELPGYRLVLMRGIPDLVTVFSEGLCAVEKRIEKDWYYSYIDTTGTVVIELGKSFTDGFFEGRARFEENGKWGFIDKNGNQVIEPVYDGAGRFSEGLAAVNKDGKVGFIDRDGNWVIMPNYPDRNATHVSWAEFHEGICKIRSDQYYYYWYIDRTGAYISQEAFYKATDFSGGMAAVSNGKLFGYIDTKGQVVIDYQFKEADPFAEGRAGILKPTGFYRYINTAGEIVSEDDMWLGADPFINGLGIIYRKGLHFVNKDFEKIISVENINSFVTRSSHGIIGMMDGYLLNGSTSGNLVYYDTTGHLIWQADPEDIFFKTIDEALKYPPEKIRKLEIDYTSLDDGKFPEAAYNFKNLEILDISTSKITTLPEGITSFKKLKKLVIYCDNLKALPNSINRLTNLEHLEINRTHIREVPANFFKMDHLRIFRISDVKLSDQHINEIKRKMPNLEVQQSISIDLN